MKSRVLQKSSLFALLIATILAGFTGPNASAQLSTATMFGIVTDSTGAIVPGATVTLTQTQTNFVRVTKTNDQGQYRAEFLPVGQYTAKVSASGFKEIVQNGIVLTATQQAAVNYALDIGGESTIVEVTTQIPLVNVGNSVLGRTVDNREVDNLPIVGRNVYQLLSLTPGIQNSQTENTIGFPGQHVIINGSSDNMVGQVTYYLDGGLNMTGVRNTGNVLPNPDAIDQFAVQTSNFSAEYGRTGAGVVSVLTKSGTNQVHGSVFEFHQETNFNSNAWLQTTRTPLHINRFGATLGGPIIKDKTFLFGSYAGLRQVSPIEFNTVVPDALQRAGNFSENLPTSTTIAKGLGACATALSAADKSVTAYGGRFIVCDPVTHQPVPGNRLDLDPNYHPDPVAAAVLAKNVPLPTPGRTDNRFIGNEGLPNQTDEFLIKGDQQLTAAHRLTLDYFQSNGAQSNLPSGSNLPGWAVNNYVYRQQTANVSDVWTVSARSVNQVWLSYTRMNAGRDSTPGTSLAAYGSDLNVQGTPSLPDISVANFFHLANAISGPVAGDNVYGLRDVFNTTRGKHSIFVGAEIYLEKDRLETLLNNYGTFSFANSTVPNTASGQATYVKTGAAIADFLIGHPNTMGQDSPDDANANYWNYGFFGQDDWRITPKLILNLGLRYDVQTAPTDTQRRYAVFKPGVQSTVSPNAILGQLFPGDPGVPQGGVDTNYNHVSPRVGFAFDPYRDGKTVFHGGAGLFFDTIGGNEWMLSQNFQPFAVRETAAFSHVTSLQNIYSTDCQDFQGCTSPFPYLYDKVNPRYVSPASLVFLQQGMRWPYNVQANFGVQQQFTKDLAVSINYVGAFSRKLPLYIDANAPIYNTANPAMNTATNYNCRRPFDALPFGKGTSCANPAVGSKYISNAYVIEDGQNTNYHGLQVTVEKRLSQHISVNGFYVFSKALSSASLQTTGNIGNSGPTEPEDYYNLGLERQRTDSDQRHQAVIAAVWKPDYFGKSNRVVQNLLNGWSISTIVTMRSGVPFNITSGTDDNMDGNNNDRPNVVPGKMERVNSFGGSRSLERTQWFDTSAYCRVGSAGCSAGTGAGNVDGTVSPNSLSGPGYKDIDAAIFRDFAIYERVKFQFRGEATNVFNFVNLGTPGAVLSSPSNFGVISAQATTPQGSGMRVIQLGGRILF
ncbi:TonB-dependent receptor [Tunturiibacter gelidoferens]|uniref:Outer membrane receptor protein involved in Fe transport n=1 Tax=Tunturiibacter gelidiferens TaxID=3069689 RepID=A0ACC5NVU2_9BACT|nr:TonB-dependent receptor [Edaphobacter lichenicola]MBB5338697.1 outer membrane receptor protein involved in Fe transport [Edaphobacter lichenicola]